METTSKPKPLWPIVFGGVALILLFVIVARLLSAFAPPAAPEDAARIEERTKAREALEAENKQKLDGFAWVDKAKETVQIPIELAKKLTVDELKGRAPAPAGPINPPAPATPAETPVAPAGAPAQTTAPAAAPAEAAAPVPAATPAPAQPAPAP
jgi:hypothetical protein